MAQNRRSSEPPARPKALRWSCYIAGAALLAWGQLGIAHGAFSRGFVLSGAGLIAVLVGVVLPELPWGQVRAAMGAMLAPWRALSARGLGRPGRGAVAPAPAAPRPQPWRFFEADDLGLSRLWLVGMAGLCLALAQFALLGGHTVEVGLLMGGIGLLMAVYLQDRDRPILIPKVNRNLGTLLQVAVAGLPLSLVGIWLLWGYVDVMTGWFFVLAGGTGALMVLWRRPLELELVPAFTPVPLGWSPPRGQAWSQRVSGKLALVASSGVCGLLANNVFGTQRLGISVALVALAIGLLMLSLPWFDAGLLDAPWLPAWLRPGLALAMAGAAFAIAMHGQTLMDHNAIGAALWDFLAAGVLLVTCLSHKAAEPGGRPDGIPEAKGPEAPWVRSAEIVAIGFFILLVFEMRAWHINVFPWGSEGDEAGGGIWAWQTMLGHYENPLISANVALHFFAVTALFFKLFGLSVGVMRYHAVIFGTASVIALYFFLRLFFGRWIAFLCALLMSCAPWHLHFSRFGHYMAEQLFCQTVAFYFVFRAMHSRRAAHWVAGGVAFGLAMLPAVASRVLPFQGIALVLYLFVARRDLLRRNLNGFLVFVVASWMVASPALVYWARVIPLSMGRAESVSIFDKTNTNAPADVMAGFVANCKINILMFNHLGDTRSRDNPLPGEKMLETWTAILFALAFFYTLYHWRDPLNVLLLGAFFINLSLSIFSVEAPQSHRTSPNLPIIFSMIAVLLWDVRRAFLGLGRRAGALLFVAVMLPAFGFFSYRAARHYFVDAKNLAYDVAPTYIGLVAGQVGKPQDQALFWASGFACSHPPVQLFKKDVPMGNYYDIADYFPVSLEPGKRHLMFLADDYEGYDAWVHHLYPHAPMQAIPNRLGGQDVATFFNLSPQDIAAAQGLEAQALGGGAARSVSGVALAWPQPALAGAREVRFSGSLSLHWFGFYTFQMSGKGDAKVMLNGRLAFQRRGRTVVSHVLRMPRGLSSLAVDIKPASPNDVMQLTYSGQPQPAHQLYDLTGPTQGTVERNMLFGWAPQGFYGRYYLGRNFKGDAVMEYVEPSLLAHWLDSPFTGDWSAVWTARLKVPATGPYRFQFNANGAYGDVQVGGKVVQRSGWLATDKTPAPVQPVVALTAGSRVPIRVRFSTSGPSWFELTWTTPNGQSGLIPPEDLEYQP